MAGDLLNRFRRDANKYATAGGYENNITLSTPDGATTITTTGLATEHFINFVTDGLDANTKNAHITISEADLIAKNYPYTNSSNEVLMRDHRVTVAHAQRGNMEYVITEQFPNATTGLIVCILGLWQV